MNISCQVYGMESINTNQQDVVNRRVVFPVPLSTRALTTNGMLTSKIIQINALRDNLERKCFIVAPLITVARSNKITKLGTWPTSLA
jgi:hypothetical protein